MRLEGKTVYPFPYLVCTGYLRHLIPEVFSVSILQDMAGEYENWKKGHDAMAAERDKRWAEGDRRWSHAFQQAMRRDSWPPHKPDEKPEDPWLLSLLGNTAYSLGVGDVMHQLKNVPGWAGKIEDGIEKVGEMLGLNVMGRPAGESGEPAHSESHVVFDRMKRNNLLRKGAYALFLGHREAIQEAQQPSHYGLALFNNALNDWKFTSPGGQIASLAVLYDLLPNEFKATAKELVGINPKIQNLLNSNPPSQRLYLTSSDKLFPENIIQPLSDPPEGMNTRSLTHPIFLGAVNLFKGFTTQRLDATFSPSV